MFHAFQILLHRPFVSESHLKSVTDSASRSASSICETAANEIDTLLRCYKKQWCMKSPPYFLSYATYVSATIHVRIAAQKSPGSKAHRCLLNCLEILSEHQNVCHAPRRSMSILLGLVRRLNVRVGREFTAEVSRTAERDISMHGSCSNVLSTNQSINMSSGDMNSNNAGAVTLQPLNTATGLNQTTIEQVSSMEPLANSEWEEQFSDMFFNMDPIFGFDISQTDIEGEFPV